MAAMDMQSLKWHANISHINIIYLKYVKYEYLADKI